MAETTRAYRKRLAVKLLRQKRAKGVSGLTAGEVAGLLGTPIDATRQMLATHREFVRVSGTGSVREPYVYGLAGDV